MSTSVESGGRREQAILQFCTLVLLALVTLKFLTLFAEVGWDLSQAPVPLLVVVAVPGTLLVLAVRRWPRVAAAIAAPLMLLFVVFVTAALIRDGLARESWADYPFAYGGILVAVVGLGAATALLKSSTAAER